MRLYHVLLSAVGCSGFNSSSTNSNASSGSFKQESSGNPLIQAPFNLVDKDWVGFEYGEKGKEAFEAFMAISDLPMIVRLTDTVRPGASFTVRDGLRVVMETPTPKSDPSKFTVNPLRAYNSPAWSHGDAVLSPGFHQLRVFMKKSPYGHGYGAIKVETTEQCPYRRGKFFLVQNVVGWDEAGGVCEAYGGRLANLHLRDKPDHHRANAMRRAFWMIKKCRVEGGLVWIASAPGKDEEGEGDFPASLQAINYTEGFTGPEWDNARMPILCEYNQK